MGQELIKTELNVINNKIGIMRVGNIDYISLTDLARYNLLGTGGVYPLALAT